MTSIFKYGYLHFNKQDTYVINNGLRSACSFLECMLLNESAEPKDLPLSLLKSITNNFSDDQQIGRGGFATVYKGILQNGTIAVKKLSQALDMDEKKFNQEASNLIRVKHKNIVRFLGYCADTQGKVEKYQGKVVMADVRQRLLCFEFLPNGGLDGYISDASQGLEWRTRYQIIKGICEGLDYLHQKKIVHLDLKPANILLNSNMVPKIADFGLSRCFDEKQSSTMTSKLVGSLGYMAPEFFRGVITLKSDIYSLGIVITEILTGQKGNYPDIENVLDSWRNRFQNSQGDENHLEEIRVCTKIGMECMDSNPAKRPTTQRIIESLNEMESRYGLHGSGMATPSATSALPTEVPGNHQQAPDTVVDAEAATGSSRSGAAQQEQQMHDCVREETVLPSPIPWRLRHAMAKLRSPYRSSSISASLSEPPPVPPPFLVHGYHLARSKEPYGYRVYQSIPRFQYERSGSDPILGGVAVSSDETESSDNDDDDVGGGGYSTRESTPGVDENEVDKKAEEFIARFREQIRRQRIESLKKSVKPAVFQHQSQEPDGRLRHEAYVSACYTRFNEDLVIVRLHPPVHKGDFAEVKKALQTFFHEVHLVSTPEIQPCAVGDAYVRFAGPLERERFLGPVFRFGSYSLSVIKHDEAKNAPSFDLDREVWIMLVTFPEDLKNTIEIAKAVAGFGILVQWHDPENLANVVAMIYLNNDANIPSSVKVNAGVSLKGVFWSVPVFVLKKQNVRVLQDEDGFATVGPLHPMPAPAPRWIAPAPPSGSNLEDTYITGMQVDGEGSDLGGRWAQHPEPMDGADYVGLGIRFRNPQPVLVPPPEGQFSTDVVLQAASGAVQVADKVV